MQKLNGREIFVFIVVAVIAIVLSILLVKELFSETSPFVSSGEFVSTRPGYIVNIGQSLLQLTLCLIALIYLIRKRRAGWIAAFAILTLYTFVGLYVVMVPLVAGIIDVLVLLGLGVSLMFLLALVFLIFPSTLKKFNISRTAIIPVICILLLLGTVAYFSTE